MLYYYFIMNNDNILQFLNREKNCIFIISPERVKNSFNEERATEDSINNQPAIPHISVAV